MRRIIPAFATAAFAAFAQAQQTSAPEMPPLRPPATPLVTHDPYFSVWSQYDRLTGGGTTHWTGKPQPMRSLIRIDGRAFRLMGGAPPETPVMPQTNLRVLPTRTIYEFANEQAGVTLTFLTPALPSDLDILARPLSYLIWEAKSLDGRPHAIQLYFDCGAEIAVNKLDQPVVWDRPSVAGLRAMRLGTQQQPVLEKQGDDIRIDWGWAYVAADAESNPATAIALGADARDAFVRDGALPARDEERQPRAPNDGWPAMALTWDLGQVGATPAQRRLMLAYDDEFSIVYFGQRLRPYWRRNGMDAAGMLTAGAKDFAALETRCRQFDAELMEDLRADGGDKYALICALAYRQALAACKLAADANGAPLYFSKENHSNGCMATVDVFYPMAPICLLFSPALMKATLRPVLDYAASPRWKFAYAPHDLGRYPHAMGQVYGGGEKTEQRQMPVEESANMLILMAALTRIEGSADFAAPHWPLLVKWADYLKEKGYDPENQLCTDDFAGHLAHNVNLSAKAIVALGAFADLCELKGDGAAASAYRQIARESAARWVKEADDGDHFRLAFDKPGTWSQKYNLVWDRILGLKLFPAAAIRKEMDFYRKTLLRYGLPLDSRKPYTKLDWTLWTASLTGERPDFEALVDPVFTFLNETPDRSPMTDWYFTDTGKKRGFTARPVVGGVFIHALGDAALWRKWAGSGANAKHDWAPIPIGPASAVAPTGQDAARPATTTD